MSLTKELDAVNPVEADFSDYQLPSPTELMGQTGLHQGAVETEDFRFEIIHQSKKSKARVGRIHTPHGTIDTPSFVAVGTNGTLKQLDNTAVNALDLDLMFCNTYHLLLQPGPEIVAKAGGLHRFINRPKPIITDSGGFQVFSLAYGGVANELKSKGTKQHGNSVMKITEEGVTFRSYRDGRKILLTPESSVTTQKALGADIIIPLDELLPYHVDEKAHQRSFERTHRWQTRSLNTHLENPNNQAMYAVVHGGISAHLRKESADYLTQLPFDGFAIGGSLGQNHDELVSTVANTVPHLPDTHPNHLLGIGDLPAIDACIPLGIDTFDSAYPTRAARHGVVFSHEWGRIKVTSGKYKESFMPIDSHCPCSVCQNHSIAYLHHLFKAHEPAAEQLASLHNVAFMVGLMKRYREAILNDEI